MEEKFAYEPWGLKKIRWQIERTKMSFCFEILWFFGAWLMTVVCWDLAMMWSFISSSLFSAVWSWGVFLGKSFYLSTFSFPDGLSCVFLNIPVVGGHSGPCCVREHVRSYVHPHSAAGRGWPQLLQAEWRLRAVSPTWVLQQQSISRSHSHL